ncbi:cell envelope integrity protein TolA, partial [Sphingobacterium multivorum]|uniref:cell envelope integrity protein TolA n=3 Tax=Sphingobacterium TaxID=28453 RepID=UPI003DA5E96D
TISGYVRGDQSLEGGFDIDFCDGDTKRFYFTSDNNWTYFEYSYNVTNYSGELYNFVDFGALGWLYYFFKDIKVEKGNKATDWTPAPEDLQAQITDSVVASKAYADAQDALKKVEANAYADGKVDAAEQRAINDATAKANAAKAYADAQDALLKAQADAYADGKITAEEQARIQQAQDNLQNAKQHAQQVADQAQENANDHTDQQVNVLQGLLDALKQKTGIDALPSGKTIVNGGQVDTDLLNAIAVRALVISAGLITASEIDVQSLFAQYIEAINFNLSNGKIGPMNVDYSGIWMGNYNSWTPNSSTVFMNSSYYLFRENGSTNSQQREFCWNLNDSTSPSYKRTVSIKNTMSNLWSGYGINTALELEASGSDKNYALFIKNGGIRVGSDVGYTGKFSIPSFNNIYFHFNYISGILVGMTASTSTTNPL